MLTLKERIVSSVSPNSAAMKEIAGENMLDARGEIKVIALIKLSNAHFLPEEKFCGFLGSSCPSQPTIPRSRSVTGNRSFAGAGEEFWISMSVSLRSGPDSSFEEWHDCATSFSCGSMIEKCSRNIGGRFTLRLSQDVYNGPKG